jgi:hypothetical protein
MKTNICTIDSVNNDFVRMEVIAVAWDNKSSYFNEYNIFPLQVQTMNDPSITSTSTLSDVRLIFLNLVDTKTCGSLVHTSIGTLPVGCNGQFSSNLLAFEKTKDIYKKALSFLDSLFPKAEAALKIEGITPTDIEASRGMMYSATFPFALHKKLESIENKTFVNYLEWALDPNLEQTIQDRKDQGIVTSPYEDTFLQCGMNYTQREAVIKDFITKLRNPKYIDVNNLTYSDPKFGDCIIPYPDKTHIGKVIDNSFPSNKLLAEQISGIYKAPPLSPDIQEMAAKENALHIEYQKTIDSLTKDFQSGKLTASGMTEQIVIEKQKLDQNVAGLYKKIASDTILNTSADMKDNSLS